jgi:glycosyltransferase involved in cell wall biosynthesis
LESISLFFPAYNDEHSIGTLVRHSFALLEPSGRDFEVIVVNDGSQDGTGRVLAALQAELGERLRIVTHPVNRGYGGALRSGFEAACKDLVFYTDGDGQYDVGELPKLIDALTPDVGLVNGYKLERNDPRHRVLIGWLYNRFAKTVFGIRIRDVDCDFRLVRRDLVDRIQLTATSGVICVELVRKLELTGCRVVEVGVHHYPRLYGRSQFFRLRSLATTFAQLCRLWIKLIGYMPPETTATYANPVR